MEFKSIDEILDFAIEKEIEAARFYQDAADHVELRGAKDVLMGYAEEERKHERILKELKIDKSKITEYKFEKIQDIKRSDYLLDLRFKPDMSYEELFRLGMKREEKAFKLYDKLAKASDNLECANFFKILAQEESKHKNSLETMYDNHMEAMGD